MIEFFITQLLPAIVISIFIALVVAYTFGEKDWKDGGDGFI